MSYKTYLLEQQYKTADNLKARIRLHERFSVNREDFHRWLFERLEAPAEARVLELGCGPATFWLKNRERVPAGWRVTLSDLSKGMIEAAREATEDIPADFSFQIADAQDLPFEDERFDLVMANHMLYHVPDERKVIHEVRRVLKPGGRFYAATNGVTHMQEIEDFIQEQLARKLPGTEFERLSLQNFTLENGEEKLRRAFKSVQLHTYPDRLEVTEAEPLLAYILSMRRTQGLSDGVLREKQQDFIAEVNRELERRLSLGPIRITKATGLFVAA